MRPPITLDATQIASVVEEQLVAMTSTLRPDYLSALQAALKSEKSSIGCLALEQLVANARLAQTEGLPLCQDTGYVWVCLEVDGSVLVPGNIFSEVDAAVARAAEAAGMRTSLLHDALVKRVNTANNTPAFCEVLLSSDSCRPSAVLHIMLKGGGSDNASALAMLPPSAGIEGVLEFVVRSVAAKGANACPPLVLGVGVGSTFDKVAGLAKYALLRPLGSTHPNEELAALEKELLARINALGIGPGGLGGSTTALAVHIHSAPCHIASLAVAVSINCTALRTSSTDLSGILAF
ncbi:MAG: fumarate hydratase [Coriobacteriia bacterium]|nr:fumarate hydratase [Coriobacteriia bacterium]